MPELTYNFAEQSKKTSDDNVYFYYSLKTVSDYFRNNGIVPYSRIEGASVRMYGDIDTSSNRAAMYVQVNNPSGSYVDVGSNNPYMVGGKNGTVYTEYISVTSWFKSMTADAGALDTNAVATDAQLRIYMSLFILISYTWKTGGSLVIGYELPSATISVVDGTSSANRVIHGGVFKLTPTVPEGYKFSHWKCSNGQAINEYSPTITVNNSLITAHNTTLTYTAIFELVKIEKILIDTMKPSKVLIDSQEVKAIYIDTTKVYG